MKSIVRHAGVLALVLAAGCGTGVQPSKSGSSARPSSVENLATAPAGLSDSTGPVDSPAITTPGVPSDATTPPPSTDPAKPDWERMANVGVEVDPGKARAAGNLKYAPIVPTFGMKPDHTRLSADELDGPGTGTKSVLFAFTFPRGPEFPTDGRVFVTEAPTSQTDADMVKIGTENHQLDPKAFQLIQLAGRPANLIQANGIGRVHFVVDGVAVDVTGPAVSPQAATRLATLIAASPR